MTADPEAIRLAYAWFVPSIWAMLGVGILLFVTLWSGDARRLFSGLMIGIGCLYVSAYQMTWSARLDAYGVSVKAPLSLGYLSERHEFGWGADSKRISWSEVATAWIEKTGSRRGKSYKLFIKAGNGEVIRLPIDHLRRRAFARLLVGHVLKRSPLDTSTRAQIDETTARLIARASWGGLGFWDVDLEAVDPTGND